MKKLRELKGKNETLLTLHSHNGEEDEGITLYDIDVTTKKGTIAYRRINLLAHQAWGSWKYAIQRFISKNPTIVYQEVEKLRELSA